MDERWKKKGRCKTLRRKNIEARQHESNERGGRRREDAKTLSWRKKGFN